MNEQERKLMRETLERTIKEMEDDTKMNPENAGRNNFCIDHLKRRLKEI